MIKVRRIHLPADPEDGFRILVDRLWPRGLSKAEAHVDHWLKDLAPSDGLRTWFGHDPVRWAGFARKYGEEWLPFLEFHPKARHEKNFPDAAGRRPGARPWADPRLVQGARR